MSRQEEDSRQAGPVNLSKATGVKVIIFAVIGLVLGVFVVGTWLSNISGEALLAVSVALAFISLAITGSGKQESWRQFAPRNWLEWIGILLAVGGIAVAVASLITKYPLLTPRR